MAVGKNTVTVPQGGTGRAGESPPPPVSAGRGCSSYSGGSNLTAVGGDDIRHTSRQNLSPNCSRRGGKWASECRFATLNVRGGMNEKLDEIYELMNERKLDVLCVNETKRKGKEILTRGPFTEIWSGVPDEEHGSKGVGILLSERMAECMREYECVSPRLIWVRLKVGLTPLFLVGVYAPDSSHSKAVREEFWEQTREVLLLRKLNERIVMLGDFNARVGVKRDGYENVLGTFGDKSVNDNGVYLLDICVEMGLSVMNTWFQHKMIHMYTWQKKEGNVVLRSMIDLVIVDERIKMKLVDTRAYRGPDVGTDHYLVISRISGLFKRWRHRSKGSTTELERIKVERLKDQQVKEMYKKQLSERLEKSWSDVNEESVNDVWSVFKTNIIKCADDVCGVSKRRRKKCQNADWWDDETRRMVEEKKKAWLDVLAIEATNRASGGMNEDNVKEIKDKYRCVKAKVKECIEKKRNEKKFPAQVSEII
ncbi:craniofacial development protein 2-like [Leptidea sinapis]|uniref:craniofacial development protein 2-like n=1 Tax=Leptidea sinapis TaxID=189913 RepID=UPI0021C371C0|nr:craniofacial development protein 2-like [Leptidea sinapis]